MTEEDDTKWTIFEKCLAAICISMGLYFVGRAMYEYFSDEQLCAICHPHRQEYIDTILGKSAVKELFKGGQVTEDCL